MEAVCRNEIKSLKEVADHFGYQSNTEKQYVATSTEYSKDSRVTSQHARHFCSTRAQTNRSALPLFIRVFPHFR